MQIMYKKYLVLLLISLMSLNSTARLSAEEIKSQEWNVYTGMFDCSDDGKRVSRIHI